MGRRELARQAAAGAIAALLALPVAARPGAKPLRVGLHALEGGVRLECDDCHGSHADARRPEGIGMSDRSSACLACHGSAPRPPGRASDAGLADDPPGRVVSALALDVEREFRKPSHHPLEGRDVSSIRRPVRAALPRLPSQLDAGSSSRGMACSDCHDPHARGRPSLIVGGAAVSGGRLLSSSGESIPEAEFCYRCHAQARGDRSRELLGRDVQALLSGDNPSAHPVDALTSMRGIPGLIGPAAGRRLTCGDCHGSEEGAAVRGPHGSAHAPLLVRAYERSDREPESPRRYALCYGCHDRGVLLGPESGFPAHRLHVVDAQSACATCHDAHGSLEHPHLLRFDSPLVTAGSAGSVSYSASANGVGGTCSMACHGHDHAHVTY